jgi:TolA-binding protein
VPDNNKMTLPLILSLCIACASTAWAVSMSVSNYRLTNITQRIDSHELVIREGEKDRSEIRMTLATIVEQLRRLREDVKEMNGAH